MRRSRHARWTILFVAVLLPLAANPALAQNLLTNPGFEQGTTAGWSPFGPAGISASTAEARSGTWSGLVSGRTDTWNGVAQNVESLVEAGKSYRIEGWVRLANASIAVANITVKHVDDAGTQYIFIDGDTADDQGWVHLSGSYTVQPTGPLYSLQVYFEGPASGVDFYVDDASLELVDWLSDANASIEAIRKRDVEIVPVDYLGQAVSGIEVEAEQTSRLFAFGSTMNGNLLINPSYREFFLDHYEWAVFENESKWYYNEPEQGNVTYATADAMMQFCEDNDLTVRGHAIFWPVVEFVQDWVRALDDTALQLAVEDRLDSVVSHFKGKFVHWDVANEMLHGSYFADRLGAGIRPWMFQQTRSIDADVQLFVNDFNIITSGEDDNYKAQILDLIAQGAPIDGIGVQGHFGEVVEPASLSDRLDNLATLGLPIWVSEYDSLNSDENARADNLEKLYRIAFGHPAVHGILMWGFWAGDHWRGPDAAIVALDWSLNADGERYEALMAEWTTLASGVSAGDGVFGFRGFHGDYRITLTDGLDSSSHLIAVEPGSGPTIQYRAIDPAACLPAGEVSGLTLTHDPQSGVSQLSWSAPVSPPGMAVGYDLLVSSAPADFVTALDCPAMAVPTTTTSDGTTPATGEARFFLVQARNRCGMVPGPLGSQTDGTPRSAADCP